MKILFSLLLTMSVIVAASSAAFASSDNIPTGKTHSSHKHSSTGKHRSGSHKTHNNIPAN